MSVGSLLSSSWPNVTIAAPSDHSISSKLGEDLRSFGGTSGAQPLVCGAIANVLSILPDVTFEEVRHLLIKTAVPTLNAREQPQMDGAGMVNAYQLVKVAKRLAPGWPASREGIFGSTELYDFKPEAAIDLRDGVESLRQADPCLKRKGANLVRSAFLLDPLSESARTILRELYFGQGYSLNAHFLDSVQGVSLAQIRDDLTLDDVHVSLSALRYARELGSDAIPILESAALGGSLTSFADADRVLIAAEGIYHVTQDLERVKKLVLNLFSAGGDRFKSSLAKKGVKYFGIPRMDFENVCFSSDSNPALICLSMLVDILKDRAEELSLALTLIDQNFSRILNLDGDLRDLVIETIITRLVLLGDSGRALLQKHVNDAGISIGKS